MKSIYSLIFNKAGVALSLSMGCLALSACSSDEEDIAAAQEEALVGNKIECALDAVEQFTLSCATERVVEEDQTILMIRHSDGGFKRFRILTDGRGLEAAEGFDPIIIEIIDDDNIMLISGADRYKLKARFTGSGQSILATGDEPIDENAALEVPIEDQTGSNLSDADVGPRGTPGVPYPIPN